jgi:hypothetical protein
MQRLASGVAKEMEDLFRTRAKEGDFGPESRYGSTYSTAEHYFSLSEPRGIRGNFTEVDSADKYVHIEGGYREYHSIVSGGGAQVDLQLTGEMLGTMEGGFSMRGRRDSLQIRAGISFGRRSARYARTTPTQRAEFVNRQHQFMHLREQDTTNVIRSAASETGIEI